MNAYGETGSNGSYRYLPALIGLTAAGMWATLTVWRDILETAMARPDAIHVFLALPVFFWLLWTRKRRWAACRPRPSLIGPLLIAAGWLASSYGYNTSGQTLWHGGALLVVIGCAVSIVGRDLLVHFMPAILALGFILPSPGFVRKPLQRPLEVCTARSGKFIFDCLGMDVDLDIKPWAFGKSCIFRYQDLELFVTDICQRTQMFFVVLVVAFLFAFGPPARGVVARVLVCLVVPVLAIVCDLIRTVPTVWYYGRHPNAVNERYHLFTVWLMVPVCCFILWGMGVLARWIWSADPDDERQDEPADPSIKRG